MWPAKVGLEDRVEVGEDVIFRELGGETVLLHLGTGIYFGLNEVGSKMWNLLQQYGSVRKTFELLQAEYDVSAAALEKDLLSLADQLWQKGLIRVAPAQPQG